MVAKSRGMPPQEQQTKTSKLDDKLSVKTDRELRERFHAACKVLGTTVQARINAFMASTVQESGIDQISAHR